MKMRFLLLLLLGSLMVAACSRDTMSNALPDAAAPQQPVAAAEASAAETVPSPALPILKQAPAWDNDSWINSDRPLRLAALRGKVVLLEFWTFG